ncbi:MarR family winged helix-turn-helix transcriptional regulator [Methanosalsum natronophilum]|uniref:MarR family winged helix-turn-helix transcriptional regulator n=1 Tax=Methanosalsum natronophilum TaxID=768733 RepID=UPI0021689015|nr:MarR family winged helix-turn-helix transcriptional regulator [Methanosalsum natronophilum]MCS3923844.1 DNA-binding MarR family transcriptional regulator [Methanosalsum natronophilum]
MDISSVKEKFDRKKHHESIGRNVSHLFRSMNIYLSKELEPYGIGSGQFPLFMHLMHHDGVRQETLASLLKYDKATITRSITRLEDMGYVIRKRDSIDKRVYYVHLTDKGENMRNVLFGLRSKLNAILLRGFDQEEQELFSSMLEKAAMNIASENEMYKVSNE